jgi:hypothetical protein
MSRIALAWELGANFAHLGRLLPLAEALRARGHRIELIIRELQRGQAVLGSHDFTMLQAPVWLGRLPPLAPTPSYAGVIRRCGYHGAPALAALVDAWTALFDLIEPDLVVAEHAPTAALAARCAGIPCLRYGTGWAAPPAVAPLPSVTPWSNPDPRRLWVAEAQVLSTVNAVLKGRGKPGLARLADLFAPRADVLATFPETDHYGPREGARYWGSTELPVAATPPEWPATRGQRIFAFVESGYAGFAGLVRDLAGLGLPTLLYARDLPGPQAKSLSSASLRVVAQPVDFATAVREASLVLCHGGHGATSGALRAGKPLLLLPRQAEQRLLAWRLAATGAALSLATPRQASADHAGALRRILDASSFAAAAEALAVRYAGYGVGAAIAGIADLCETALGAPAPQPAGEGRHAS